MRGRRGTAGLTRGVLQMAAAVAVHAAAAGCLPSARGLAVALPVGLVALLMLDRVLADQPLASVACGQLTAHSVLTVAAACTTASNAHTGAGSHVPMIFGHVAALVVCRAALGRAVLLAERGADLVLGLARRVLLVMAPVGAPVLPRLSDPAPAALVGRVVTLRACVRGPPRGVLLLVS